MLKKIIFGLVVIAIILSGFFFFYSSKNEVASPSNAIKAVPIDAAAVIVIHDFKQFHNQLTNGNIIFESLSETPYFQRFRNRLHFIDSLSKKAPFFKKMLDKNDVICSAHLSGSKQFGFLFAINKPAENKFNIIDYIKNELGTSLTQSDYDQAKIFECQLGNSKKKFFFSIYKHIFIGSFSSIIIESSIRQLDAENSLLQREGFLKVQRTAEKNATANIFICYKNAAHILSSKFKNQFNKKINELGHYARWTELDLKVNPSNVILNGFTYCPDSTNHFLTVFKNQSPVEMGVTTVLPENTAFLTCYGISNINDYFKRYKYFLQKQGRLRSYKSFISKFERQYNFQVDKEFKNWIGNEIAIAATEASSKNIDKRLVLAMQVKDKEKALSFFKRLNTFKDSTEKQNITYLNYEIQRFTAFPNFFGNLLGSSFQSIKGPYYTFIGRYLVMANSLSNLRNCINYYESGKSLYLNINYSNFRSNLVSESNIFIYSAISRSAYFYKHYLNDELAQLITQNDSLFKKFEAVAIQINYEKNDLYYNNIFLKYNPVYKKETNSMWETELAAPIIYGPQLFRNHYTNALETIVQDSLYNMYLISNTGKIIWQKQLSDKIASDIYPIDAYKNKKLQMVFNTESKLWVMDRTGTVTENFPVDLPAEASADVAVLDYDNNRDYRLLIPCKDNKVYNYDDKGKLIEGWKMKKTNSAVVSPIYHFKIKSKDYIVCIEKDGGLKVVERNGEDRLKIKNKLPDEAHIGLSYQIGSSLKKSRLLSADSLGNIYSIYFDDKKETMHFKDCDAVDYFVFSKIDTNSYAYLLTDSNTLFVYDDSKQPLFQFGAEDYLLSKPIVFKLGNIGHRIGVCDISKQQIYLFKITGEICNGFPLFGGDRFKIADINLDGTEDMVTYSGNKVYAYSLSLK